MGNIEAIANIASDRERAKDIACRVQKKRSKGDYRCFADILMEEIEKVKRGEKNDKKINY